MPQTFTNLLNKTVEDIISAASASSVDSVSVRLEGMQEGSFVQIEGVSFGVLLSDNPTILNGTFSIIRNEVFNPTFAYGFGAAQAGKDVVFEYRLSRSEAFKEIDFSTPMLLNDAQNYLLIFSGIFDNSGGPPNLISSLTVRGRFIETGRLVQREVR